MEYYFRDGKNFINTGLIIVNRNLSICRKQITFYWYSSMSQPGSILYYPDPLKSKLKHW